MRNIGFFPIILLVMLVISIRMNFANQKNGKINIINNDNAPTHKSERINTVVYSSEGILSYRLISQHMESFSKENIIWFVHPVLLIYNKEKVPIWLIKSNLAKMNNSHVLYLHGKVEVNALTSNFQKLRKITTENAQINLITQDIKSKDRVMLYGTSFNSSGSRMHGNLRKKHAELIEKVKAFYEMQKR